MTIRTAVPADCGEVYRLICILEETSLPRIAEIMECAVDPACRSRGIGKEMFARACADARAAGCVQIELATNQRRTGAHHFYAREGMRCSHYSFTLPLV